MTLEQKILPDFKPLLLFSTANTTQAPVVAANLHTFTQDLLSELPEHQADAIEDNMESLIL